MRNWKSKIFMGEMPGRSGGFDLWLEDIEHNGITSIVSLAREEEIAEKSPEYAQWWESGSWYDRTSIPIPDWGIPEDLEQIDLFWYSALDIGESIEQNERVFVHCAAGIGRTGMFAIAVLLGLGYSYEDAYKQIQEQGSCPEVDTQIDFVSAGPPAAMLNNRTTYGFDWRPDQRSLTRRIIENLDVPAFSFQMGGPNKGCMLNHLNGRTGYLSLADAMADTYRVFDYETDELLGTYNDVDDLINKGWKVST
jgi:hypothetical protein